jgi:hypothetical protein
MDLPGIKRAIDDINSVLRYKYFIIAAYALLICCILFVIYMFLNYSFIYIVLILLNIIVFVGLYYLKLYIQAKVIEYQTIIETQLSQIQNIPENMIPEEIKRQRDEFKVLISKAKNIIDEILGIFNIIMGIKVLIILYAITMIGMMYSTETNGTLNTARINNQRIINRSEILRGGKRK